VAATTVETSRRSIDIAAKVPGLGAVIGIHPIHSQDGGGIQELEELAKDRSELIVAVGETGLDYLRLPSVPSQAQQLKHSQQQLFAAQLELAGKLDLPVIIHIRDRDSEAHWDALSILKENHPGRWPFILHCVSGPEKYLKQALELGAYVGLAGNVTYPSADGLRQLVTMIPPDRLLVETDAPFLPPQSHRGQTCLPWMVADTAQYLHHQLNLSLDELCQNTLTCFHNLSSKILVS